MFLRIAIYLNSLGQLDPNDHPVFPWNLKRQFTFYTFFHVLETHSQFVQRFFMNDEFIANEY